MSIKRTIPLATAAALIAAAPAAAGGGTATVTISHQMMGCHMWQLGNGNPKVSLAFTVKAGTTLRVVDNDIMPHRLIQQAGPKLTLVRPDMNKMSASTAVKLARAGVYRFTTRAGEDYAWMRSMKTTGADNVLHLTVHVK
jgi:hypothetical protein